MMDMTCDKCPGMVMAIVETEVVHIMKGTPGDVYNQTQKCPSCGRTIYFAMPCVVLEQGNR